MSKTLALVTGAPGWLGNRLVRSLVEGLPEVPALAEPDRDRRVRCLVLPGIDTGSLRAIAADLELVEGDVRDAGSLARFFAAAGGATLFHLVGLIHPTRGIQQLYEVNVRGTRHVLDAAIRAGVKRIVAISSNSPIGCNPHKDHLFDEHAPYNPYMNYGTSKKMVEEMVNEAGAGGRIETVILRPCWFYGPDQPPRQLEFFRMVRDGKAPIVGRGDTKRSMSYVDNTAQALLLSARVEAARGQTYWIADRRPYTMNEIVDTVEDVLEHDFGIAVQRRRLRLPNLASEVAWFVDSAMQALGMYHPKVHVLSEMNKTIACSIAKAERDLGYDPRIELREGMKRSIADGRRRGLI